MAKDLGVAVIADNRRRGNIAADIKILLEFFFFFAGGVVPRALTIAAGVTSHVAASWVTSPGRHSRLLYAPAGIKRRAARLHQATANAAQARYGEKIAAREWSHPSARPKRSKRAARRGADVARLVRESGARIE